MRMWAQLSSSWKDVRAAFDHALQHTPEIAAQAVGPLLLAYVRRGPLDEGIALGQALLGRSDLPTPLAERRARATIELGVAWLMMFGGSRAEGHRYALQAATTFDHLGDRLTAARATCCAAACVVPPSQDVADLFSKASALAEPDELVSALVNLVRGTYDLLVVGAAESAAKPTECRANLCRARRQFYNPQTGAGVRQSCSRSLGAPRRSL